MDRIIFEGSITTVSPLSIAMPDGGQFNGFPMMARGISDDGEIQRTGYLPATTVRGFLRRAIVLRTMKAAADSGAPYSLPKAYAELIGQDAESEKQAGEIDLLAIKKMREESPVVDLFGSGLGVISRLRVSHFAPATNIDPQQYRGVRKDLGDTDGVVEMLSDSDAEKYYGRETANSRRAQAGQLVKKLEADVRKAKRAGESLDELEAQLEEAKKVVDRHQKDMGGMLVSSRTLVDYFALPADLPLSGKLVVMRAQERDLEMLEYGLDSLSRNPVLGAQSARGCGEIRGSFDVFIDGELTKKISIGGYKPSVVDNF